jgi:hypothetical protein
MGLLYRGKVLPKYSVASVPVGGIPFDQLDRRVAVDTVLPAKIALSKNDKKQQLTPKELGIAIDWPATRERLKQARPWLPLLTLFTHHEVAAKLQLNQAQFDAKAKELESTFAVAALPERIELSGDNFAIVPPKAGYKLDTTALQPQVMNTVEQGKTTLNVPTTATTATEPTGKLGSELALLQKRLDAKITLTYGGQNKQLTRNQIGRFYEPTGQTMQLSISQMTHVIGEVASALGVTAPNQSEAVQASMYALFKSQPVTFVLAAANARVYHYCTAVKGVNASLLPEYRQKLAATYGDPRGWSQGGAVMVYAESGCDYTAWLSAPEYMTGFGPSICDNYYSCRVGPNVVVNYDRWMGATDPWNAAGGGLEDYRVMVINHETGHWLGFAHRFCTGAGQLAPVMQQQSIDLQGCKFNPWPTPSEIAAL